MNLASVINSSPTEFPNTLNFAIVHIDTEFCPEIKPTSKSKTRRPPS